MNRTRTVLGSGLLTALLLAACTPEEPQNLSLFRAPAIPNTVDGVVFEAGDWEPHLAAGDEGDSWGNHRAVVVVDDTSAEAVIATIPWRRRDADPAAKSIVVLDASSGGRRSAPRS